MLRDLRENFASSKDVNETLMSDSTVKKKYLDVIQPASHVYVTKRKKLKNIKTLKNLRNT